MVVLVRYIWISARAQPRSWSKNANYMCVFGRKCNLHGMLE